MVQDHQRGQAVFRSILPEDMEWKPFPAFPLRSTSPSLSLIVSNLDFHGLAAEQALQLAHPSFQLTDTARADDILVSLDRLQAAFQHSSTPVEQQARSDTRSPGHVGHRHPGLHRLLYGVQSISGSARGCAQTDKDVLSRLLQEKRT
jgi:hypothetical protein